MKTELDTQKLNQQFSLQTDEAQKRAKNGFIEDCRELGYEPTQPEIEMYFERNAFSNGMFQRCFDIEGIDISKEQFEAVDRNLAAWGENEDIIGNPLKELATNLYVSLWWGLDEILQFPNSIDDAKKTREALLRGDSNTPLTTTIPYMASSLNGESELKRNLLKFVGFKQHQKVKTTLNEFGFGFGVVARKALEKRYGQCLMTLIQSGNDERVRKTAIQAIVKLNRFYGLDRYTDEACITEAVELVSNAIEPIRNVILVTLNGRLSPILSGR